MNDDMTLNVTLHPEDSGKLRTVMVGMGNPTVIVELIAGDDGIVIEVEGPDDKPEVAALLYMVALTLDPTLDPEESRPVTADDEPASRPADAKGQGNAT